MHLILSSRHARDSLYSTDTGQVLYKVDKSGSGATAIRRAMNNGGFASYAEVEFHTFKSTRFRFNNLVVPVDKYFRKEGWCNPKWIFRAADGREYHWRLDGTQLEMFRNDGGETGVVKFQERKSSFGGLATGRPASLEIDDSCVPILDEIMMTFIYCQKQRKNRQTNRDVGVDAGCSCLCSLCAFF